jgi:hypothetical protein
VAKINRVKHWLDINASRVTSDTNMQGSFKPEIHYLANASIPIATAFNPKILHPIHLAP